MSGLQHPAPAAPPTPQKKAPWKSSVDPSFQLRPQWSESWGPQRWLNAVLRPQKRHPDLQSTPSDSNESPQPPRASGNPVTSQACRLDLPTRSPPPSNQDDELKPLTEGGEGEPDCSHRNRRPGRYSWFLSFPTERSAGRSDSRLIITSSSEAVVIGNQRFVHTSASLLCLSSQKQSSGAGTFLLPLASALTPCPTGAGPWLHLLHPLHSPLQSSTVWVLSQSPWWRHPRPSIFSCGFLQLFSTPRPGSVSILF